MPRPLGLTLLALSACGYPLTQAVIRRFGSRGAGVVEAVSVGLAVRDAVLIRSGTPRRLRPVPGTLLWIEFCTAIAASASGLLALVMERVTARSGVAVDISRRLTLGALFGLHTIRFFIYLRPDRGRRS